MLNGAGGSDTVDYGRETGGSGVNVNLQSGTGTDTFGNTDALTSIENAIGSAFNDTLVGTSGANTLEGGGGADALFGGDGSDVLIGGAGSDTLVGNASLFANDRDVLSGGDGDDTLQAEAADTVSGGGGSDVLIVTNGYSFALNMGTASIEYAVLEFGDDRVDASGQTAGVSVFASGGADMVTGSSWNDLVFGGVGNDVIDGGAGADAIVGNEGVDQLNGGTGDDRVYFDAQDSFVFGGAGYDAGYITPRTGAGVLIDLGASSLEFLQDGAGGGDTVSAAAAAVGVTVYAGGGNDVVTGSSFADVIWGEAGTDTLVGAGGADVLVGGSGADVISGGAGIDALYGSSGSGGDGAADVFKFAHSGAADFDFVFDFVSGTDKLDFIAFGTSFASVSLVNQGANVRVLLNGQLVCVVADAAGTLKAIDFVFSGSAAGEPFAALALGDGAPDETLASADRTPFEMVQSISDATNCRGWSATWVGDSCGWHTLLH